MEQVIICLAADQSTGWLHDSDIADNCGVHTIEASTQHDYSRDNLHKFHRRREYDNC